MKYMSQSEVIKLGIPVNILNKHMERGWVEYEKIGKTRVLLRESVKDWIRNKVLVYYSENFDEEDIERLRGITNEIC
jgi:hypothetical protein